jgi:hypothetical protein
MALCRTTIVSKGVIRRALLLFKRSHKGSTTVCFKKSPKKKKKRDCLHLNGTLQNHCCFKRSHKGRTTVCFKKSHKRDCFYIKTQSCFQILSHTQHKNNFKWFAYIKRSYKEGIVFNQNSAFDLKLPRTLFHTQTKVSLQWFIYIQKKKKRVTRSSSYVDKRIEIRSHSLKTMVCIGVIRSSSYIGERIEIRELYD